MENAPASLAGVPLQSQAAGQCNHRAVIGTEFQLRVINAETLATRLVIQRCAQLLVGADAAGHHQLFQPGLLHRLQRFFDQYLDDGLLKGPRRVGLERVCHVIGVFANQCQHCRLQAGKTEVQIAGMQHRPRQLIHTGRSLLSQLRQQGAARIRQTEQLGALVKRLACRIIQRFTEQFVLADGGHRINCVWPPETSSATNGNVGGVLDSSGDNKCPSR
jgi:hypothetical protein